MSLTFSAWCLVTYSGAWILLVRPPTIITVDWLIGTAVCQSRAPSSNCFCLTQLNSSKSIKSIESNRIGSKSNRIESNQIESNRIESNQIKSNQIKSNQIKSNQSVIEPTGPNFLLDPNLELKYDLTKNSARLTLNNM